MQEFDLSSEGTVFKVVICEKKSSSIEHVRRMKIVIPISKNCLVICERFKSRSLCFELNAVEKYNFLEKLFEAVTDKSYFHLVAVLFEKKKKERRLKDAMTKIGNFVYIAADMHTSWKKIKPMCL